MPPDRRPGSLGGVDTVQPYSRDRPVSLLHPSFQVREAAVGDIPLLAHHRGAMFRDMGRLASGGEAALVRATAEHLRDAMPRGEYLAWVAQSGAPPEPIG